MSGPFPLDARWRRRFFPAASLAVFLLCLLVYLPGLSGPLLFDDYPNLGALLEGANLGDGGWLRLLLSDSGPLGRPVAMLSFLLNALAAGDQTVYWKAANLALHLLNGLLTYLLIQQLVQARLGARAPWLALFVAGAWLLHPLQVSTVLYTVQRMTQLSALFVLAGLLAYAHGRRRQLAGLPGMLWVRLSVFLCLPLAVLSKETGVLLPWFAMLLEFFLFRLRGDVGVRRELLAYAGALVVLPAILALTVFAWGGGAVLDSLYQGRGFTAGQRILTQFRVLWYYLSMILLPAQQRMGFFHDDITLSQGWLDPPSTLPAFLAVGALLSLAVLARRRAPLFGLGVAFFFVGQLSESSPYPLETAYEHRNYLPLLGIVLALTAGLLSLPIGARWRRGIGIGAFLLLALLTFLRVQTWASEEAIYTYAHRVHPLSPRAAAGVAEGLTRKARLDEALAVLAPLRGRTGPDLHRRYLECLRDGTLGDGTILRLRRDLAGVLEHYALTGLMELARMGLEGQCRFPLRDYKDLLAKAVRARIHDQRSRAKLWLYLAQYHWRLGEPEAGYAALEQAHRADSANPAPLFLGVEWMLQQDNAGGARGYLERAARTSAAEAPASARLMGRLARAVERLEDARRTP